MLETTFLHKLAGKRLSIADRAIAVLWFHGRDDHLYSATPSELARTLEKAGYPKANISRLNVDLAKDRRTAKIGTTYRLTIAARNSLDAEYESYCTVPIVRLSDSVIPRELTFNTRGYIEAVVRQINASFDAGLYDCCAVMCRRLLETLIIEVYEHYGWSSELKGNDGHYKMLSGLLSHVEKEKRIAFGRGTLRGLKSFKDLGDNSAHNRRFIARKDDIERQRDGLRLAVEEFVHLADFGRAAA